MPTSLEEWFNHWYYYYCYNPNTNTYVRNSLTTSSTSTEGLLSDYAFNCYTPQFDIKYDKYKPKKRKLDLE